MGAPHEAIQPVGIPGSSRGRGDDGPTQILPVAGAAAKIIVINLIDKAVPAEKDRCRRGDLDVPHRSAHSYMDRTMPVINPGRRIPERSAVGDTAQGRRIEPPGLGKTGSWIDHLGPGSPIISGLDHVKLRGN